MKKIRTYFVRSPEDRRYVINEVHPDCQWVAAGEGIATRKYDGTCMLLDEQGRWWARREVKTNKAAPDHFVEVEYDPITGKKVGWEPIKQSPFAKFHAEAVEPVNGFGKIIGQKPLTGTYELIGPKINGNPERCTYHRLERHDNAERFADVPVDFDKLRDYMAELAKEGIEGIVWHHPDGRMAKLKVRDFPRD